ncbi:MAG: hypothetical protein LWX07_10720 [Bacteroidetes bacterium]|nr:hypothetical protein [Bacteroidota bacterium]
MAEENKYGISLGKFAELMVKIMSAGEDEIMYKDIIESEGFDFQDWIQAKKEWEKEINDPADEGRTFALFLPLYQTALENQYFERVPCTLDIYAKVQCEISLLKDPYNPTMPMDYEAVVKKNGFTVNEWENCNSFWAIRVSLPRYKKKFAELVRKYIHNIEGLQ